MTHIPRPTALAPARPPALQRVHVGSLGTAPLDADPSPAAALTFLTAFLAVAMALGTLAFGVLALVVVLASAVAGWVS